mgnify:CR=1 FL=1
MFEENGQFMDFGVAYTDEEMVRRAWDREMIADTVGRFVLYWGNGEMERALDELWVREPEHQKDASFGVNTGFFVGMDEVRRHLVTERLEKDRESLAAYQAAFPDKGYTDADLGLGVTRTHSCTTPLYYIANDGQTARYLGYDLGMSARSDPDGTVHGFHEIGLFYVEFVREGETFKIWHMVEQHDFSVEGGRDYNDYPMKITDPNDPHKKEYGAPTVLKDVYDETFGWEYLFYDMPKPYKTYSPEEGYGAQGKIGKKFYERMI